MAKRSEPGSFQVKIQQSKQHDTLIQLICVLGNSSVLEMGKQLIFYGKFYFDNLTVYKFVTQSHWQECEHINLLFQMLDIFLFTPQTDA